MCKEREWDNEWSGRWSQFSSVTTDSISLISLNLLVSHIDIHSSVARFAAYLRIKISCDHLGSRSSLERKGIKLPIVLFWVDTLLVVFDSQSDISKVHGSWIWSGGVADWDLDFLTDELSEVVAGKILLRVVYILITGFNTWTKAARKRDSIRWFHLLFTLQALNLLQYPRVFLRDMTIVNRTLCFDRVCMGIGRHLLGAEVWHLEEAVVGKCYDETIIVLKACPGNIDWRYLGSSGPN